MQLVPGSSMLGVSGRRFRSSIIIHAHHTPILNSSQSIEQVPTATTEDAANAISWNTPTEFVINNEAFGNPSRIVRDILLTESPKPLPSKKTSNSHPAGRFCLQSLIIVAQRFSPCSRSTLESTFCSMEIYAFS